MARFLMFKEKPNKLFMHQDCDILTLLDKKQMNGWEMLYDKYAAVLYGIILRNTSDVKLAEKMLIQLFVQLKNTKLDTDTSLALQLIKQAHIFCRAQAGDNTPPFGQVHKLGTTVGLLQMII